MLHHAHSPVASSSDERTANTPTATDPKCPQGIIQWQHGKFEKLADGSLKLHPIRVDGRQMYSDPCLYQNSIYTRYNASETFEVHLLPRSSRPPNPLLLTFG